MLTTGLAVAEEAPPTVTGVIGKEVRQLGDEARALLVAPVDTEDAGLVKTAATLGAVGLVYVFDNDIREKVQGVKSANLDKAADAGSVIGSPYLHLGVAAALYGGGLLADSPRYRELGEMLGEAALLADASTLILKEAIGRSRPFLDNGKSSFRPFQFRSDYDSAPSMHTASSFAMASVMAATSDSLATKLLSYAAATFVGFSRMYQDKHWASDVLLGAAIGELCGRVVIARHVGGDQQQGFTIAPSVMANGVALNVSTTW
jgi:hypothetical protein